MQHETLLLKNTAKVFSQLYVTHKDTYAGNVIYGRCLTLDTSARLMMKFHQGFPAFRKCAKDPTITRICFARVTMALVLLGHFMNPRDGEGFVGGFVKSDRTKVKTTMEASEPWNSSADPTIILRPFNSFSMVSTYLCRTNFPN
jgi:hypothetical protein